MPPHDFDDAVKSGAVEFLARVRQLMTSARPKRSLGTLMAIARTRVAADRKTGATTPPGVRALAEIVDESSVTVHSEPLPEIFHEEGTTVSGDT